jgi:ribosome maturation factor RimP
LFWYHDAEIEWTQQVGAHVPAFSLRREMSAAQEQLWEHLEQYFADESVELDDVEVRGRGPGRVVKVTVDAKDGVGVDRLADLSRGVSRLLDSGDLFAGPFILEVSSPGLERPLRRHSHYRKSIGREVVLKTRTAVAGDTSHRGILEGATDDQVTVRVGGETRVIDLDEVSQGRTVFRWEKPAKPGRK